MRAIFTSVDVGPVFGELLAVQLAEMAHPLSHASFDLVEAGAGNGRLACDAAERRTRTRPEFYAAIRLHLVERSPSARAAQAERFRNTPNTFAAAAPTSPRA